MSDEPELPSSGGSYTRTKTGLRLREAPTQDGPPPPAEPQEAPVTTPETEA